LFYGNFSKAALIFNSLQMGVQEIVPFARAARGIPVAALRRLLSGLGKDSINPNDGRCLVSAK